MTTTEVQSGLEGVVAFATEIAEPDKEGGALRYRGVDIEDLVGVVPYEKVWGLLVDGSFDPGPAARPSRTRCSCAPATRASTSRPALAMLAPEWGMGQVLDISDEQARTDLARASVMALSFAAQSARGIGVPWVPQSVDRRGQHDRRALPPALARRGAPRPRQGDRRVLDLRRRARHERLDVHRARHHLDGRRRRRRDVRRRRRAVRPAARRRALARADDARRGRRAWATPTPGSRPPSTAATA